MTEQDRHRYAAAAHAMQSGVAMTMNWDDSACDPKHLRVGVNAAMVDAGGLAKLLMDKGIFTLDEYEKYIADAMETEVARYEEYLRKHSGNTKITLG